MLHPNESNSVRVAVVMMFVFIFSSPNTHARLNINSVEKSNARLVIGSNAHENITMFGSSLNDIKQILVLQNNRAQTSQFDIQLKRSSGNSRTVTIRAKPNSKVTGSFRLVAVGSRGEKIDIPVDLTVASSPAQVSGPPSMGVTPNRIGQDNRIPVSQEAALRAKGIQGKAFQPKMAETVKIIGFKINGGSGSTLDRDVVLNHNALNNPTQYRAGERSNLNGVPWKSYVPNPPYSLSEGEGVKTVYLEVRGPDVPSPQAPGVNVSNVFKANDKISLDIPDSKYRGTAYYRNEESIGISTTGDVTLTLENYPSQNSGEGQYHEKVDVPVFKKLPDESCSEGLVAGKRSAYQITVTKKTINTNVRWQKKMGGKVLIKALNPQLFSEGTAAGVGVFTGETVADVTGNKLTANEYFLVLPPNYYKNTVIKDECKIKMPFSPSGSNEEFTPLKRFLASLSFINQAWAMSAVPSVPAHTLNNGGSVEWDLQRVP